MDKTFMMAIAAAFLAAPLALAHEPAGTPDRFCTGPANVHDYGPSTGSIIITFWDGNAEECQDVPELQPFWPCTDPTVGTLAEDVCAQNTPVDYDREQEYGIGGALLAAQEPASLDCWNTPAHHPVNPVVYAEDLAFGSDVRIVVSADWSRDASWGCGDSNHEACDYDDPAEPPGVTCNPLDQEVEGVGTGTYAPFGPGEDGTYVVFVWQPHTQGHVWT